MNLKQPTVVTIAVLTAAAGLLFAGPLTPPAGPVSSSYKTLTEVEPRTAINAANTPGTSLSLYRIARPGSYYLTGNLTGVSGKYCIEIASSDVTIDLNGFTLIGVPGAGVAVVTLAAQSGITITNGDISGWPGGGLSLSSATSSRISYLTVHNCGSIGMNCGDSSVIEHCSCSANADYGFYAPLNCTVRDCTANGNSSFGFGLSNGTTVDRCHASNNTSTGFSTSNDVVITNSFAYQNGGDGFAVTFGCSLTGCTSEGNTGDGMVFGGQCLLRDNFIRHNAAGLHGRVEATRCRIQGNELNNNQYGLRLDGANNLVMGNAAGDNSINYQIVANNRVGTISSMPLSTAINGSTGGTSGPVDAASNFSY